MRPSRRNFLLGGGAALVLVACGDDGESAVTTTTAAPDVSVSVVTPEAETTNGLDGELPPVDALGFEPLLGDRLSELGLVLTDRGGLIDTRNGQYVQSPNGNHVALYAEPAGEYTDEQYIDGILEVTRLSAPVIFERWPTLETYDICQEPRTEEDDREEPLPATQIFMTNQQVAAIDWGTVTAVDLVAGSLADPPTVERLTISTALQEHPRYQEIFQQAEAQVGA